mgnify:CR=1 FL=1
MHNAKYIEPKNRQAVWERNHAACLCQQRRLIAATIRFFDLFSGIGGFREGLRRAGGFTCVGHCEVDAYADKNYRLLFDTEGEWFCNDARTIETDRMPDFDLLSPESGKDLQMPEELCSSRLPDWLQTSDLRISSLKMFPDCFRMTKAGRFTPSSVCYLSWGTVWNGKCLTARILESPNPESGCILSDILIEDVPEKYYLSQQQMERLLFKSRRADREKESTMQKG